MEAWLDEEQRPHPCGRVTGQMGCAVALASKGSERALLQELGIHTCLDSGSSSHGELAVPVSVRGPVCSPP